MQIGDFNIGKGLGKFLLGILAVGLTFAVQNPGAITTLIPEKWATITIAGAIIELLDYLLHKIRKK